MTVAGATTPDVDLQALFADGRPLPYLDPAHQAAAQFLTEEADALDRRDFQRWLSMLAPDVRYRVPVRVTAAGSTQANELTNMGHFDEDLYSLEKRVQRFATEHAWAEDPPSRTRRFVTNVRTIALDTPGSIAVQSYLLLYRSRGDVLTPNTICGARFDLLRDDEGGHLQLARRLAVLDDSVIRTQNLAVFI